VQAGGNFNQMLGIELGYADFGHMQAFGGDTEAKATSISLTAGLPLGPQFGLFAKAGGAYGRTEVTASPTVPVFTGKKSGWGSTWGVGATFAVTPNVQVRADWDRYKLDFVGGEHDVDFLSAGVQLRF
jgi:opacity protein-like surface antigen